MRNSTLLITLVPLSMLTLAACGASDSRRVTSNSDAGVEAGNGGSAGSGTGGIGGGSGGGNGGASAGSGGTAGSGGAGGALSDASFEDAIFFSVAPSAKGLPNTGVSSKAPHPETTIFASVGMGPSHAAGTNVVAVTAAQLGLLDTDDIDAIGVLKPVPVHPLYYFSVKNDAHTEGYPRTDVNRSALEGELPGDIFASEGVGVHYDGESGNRPGPNVLVVDEARLGLQPAVMVLPGDAGAAVQIDDLDALELGVTGVPSRLYFSVRRSAAGPSGSGVAGTAAAERGCTIYESTLDGSHRIAYHCADLGLVAGDELDALDIQGASAPTQILFSVEAGAVGAVGSAVATQVAASEAQGDIFRSTGSGTNELLVDEAALGLLPNVPGTPPSDDLDALAVRDVELKPKFEAVPHCLDLVPNPHLEEASLATVVARGWVNSGIFTVLRQLAGSQTYELVAYDANTCGSVGAPLVLDPRTAGGSMSAGVPLAVIPGAGWIRTNPLANVEIWSVSETNGTRLVHYGPGGGTPTQVVPIGPSISGTLGIVHRTTTDDFAITFNQNSTIKVAFVPRPSLTATGVTASGVHDVPFPCDLRVGFLGYDPASNGIDLSDGADRARYVCQLDSELWFREPPRKWLPGQTGDAGTPIAPPGFSFGFIVPGEAMYGFDYSINTERIYVMPPVP